MGRRAALAAAAVTIMFATSAASGAPWLGPPVNLTLPSISGTPQVGSMLTARYGKWRGKNMSYAYTWLRCDSTGGNCSAFGATQSTYVLVPNDAGATMRVAVTASNQYGSTLATTPATAVIAPEPTSTPPTPTPTAPANTAAPTISGSAQQGQTLTATTGSWGGSTPLNYAYQWQRCDSSGGSCAPLAVTGTTDVLASADVGSTIRVSVTASNTAGTATATSAPTAPVAALPASAPTPAPAPGTVFCFGDPAYGFQGNYTSNGWGRQYPFNHPERVSYDDSVSVMQSVGCHTIRAELRSGDLDTKGGTVNLRAQTYKDPSQTLYDTMGTNRGQTNWYGFAFSTNAGYVPQSDPNNPNWNAIYTWHSTGEGAGNPITLGVATKGYSGTDCSAPGFSYVPFSDGKPHLMLEVNGGDPAKWPTGGATCLRFPGPVFVPGYLYRVQEKVTWSDNYQGAVEWWVDGVKYADVTGVCTLQLSNNVYPLFENYRPFATTFPTADVYYGGLIKGSSQAAVTVP